MNETIHFEQYPQTVMSIAKSFQMGQCRLMYLVNYGLAQYFKNDLIDKVKECEVFVVSFDESLNSVTYMCQMDLMLRYFD